MLATVLHGMQGTPYVYQGEELGMTNVRFEDIDSYKDIETLNMYRERLESGYAKEDVMRSIYAKSRDNARTPMQWDPDDNAGFTTGTPWIAVNPNYTEINAEDERKDPDSVYHYYRKLIHMRKEYPVFVDGRFELLLPDDGQVFAYERRNDDSQMLICANFTGEAAECPVSTEWKDAQVLIHNYKDGAPEQTGDCLKLRPYEAFILYR